MAKTKFIQQPNIFPDVNLSNICAIGIDVSKNTLDICLASKEGICTSIKIGNSESDIVKFAESIKGYTGKIIMESTGFYQVLAALILREHNFDVRVINPLLAVKYVKSSIRKVKTDKKDAVMLAKMAIIEDNLPDTFNSTRKEIEIKKKINLIGSLEKNIQKLNSVINDFKFSKEIINAPLSSAEENIIDAFKNLKKQKSNLEKEVEKLSLEDSSENKNKAELIQSYCSIPGISAYVASLVSVQFSAKYQDNPKQWIAYSGLDVSVRESGMKKGRSCLTKRGDAYLRKRLFSAAWGAVMHSENFKKYYDHLRETGRSYIEAMTIIARKLVRILFSLTKNNSKFDPAKPLFNPAS